MKPTIKRIQGNLIENLIVISLIFGLVAVSGCVTQTTSWEKSNDSPWATKRTAEASSASVDTFVEVSLDEPTQVEQEFTQVEEAVVVTEELLEPLYTAEPDIVAVVAVEPEPFVEPAVADSGSSIMDIPQTSFAVQVFAGNSRDSADHYQSSHGLSGLQTVKTDRNGSAVYVLVSIHDNRGTARQAASDLELQTGSKPWVRSIAGLQKIAM